MESFYGGRQGTSFVIKKRFKYLNKQDPAYIKDLETKEEPDLFPDLMEENLSDSNYKDVWYNEYCIIDTTNKNNPENGKIFRRTLQTQSGEGEESSPYEYIGQIVGPSAGVPMLNIRPSLLTPTELQDDLSGDWDGLGWEDGKGNKVLYDPSVSLWPKEYNATTIQTTLDQLGDAGISGIPEAQNFELVAGYTPATETEEAKYNDTIRYNWYNVRKNTENNAGVVESWCYIGMEIPYTVITPQTTTVYNNEPNVYEIDDSKSHPFWYEYMFEIPRGQRGVSVSRIFISENQDAYPFDTKLAYNAANDTYSISDDVAKKNYDTKSWFCEVDWYNPQSDDNKYSPSKGQSAVFYLGLITELKNASFTPETGHLLIEYHNRDDDNFYFNYPKKLEIYPDTGVYQIYYTREEQPVEGQFGFVKEVQITEDKAKDNGDVIHGKMTFVNTVNEKTKDFNFAYPQSLSISENGNWEILNFGKEKQTGQLVFPKTISAEGSTGEVKYTDSAGETHDAGTLEYVTSVYMENTADNGQVYYDTTTKTKQPSGQLVFVDDVQITSTHELLIAFTDNSRIAHDVADEKVLNDKTYINYGQTISKLGIESSSITGIDKEAILEQFETVYSGGIKDGEVTGQLFVVTTSDENNPISYFVMWNPDVEKWEIVSEIAGSPVGVPAQIGHAGSWTYQDSLLLADGYVQFTQLFGNENTINLTSWWK